MMHTFVQTPEATQQATPVKSTILGRPHVGHSLEVSSILHVQRTIENQAVLRSPQAKSDGLEAVSNAAAPGDFGHDFSRIPVFSTDRTARPQPSSPRAAKPLPVAIQAKLVVGQANDPLEHEADRIADQVMRMPAPLQTAGGATLQRKCAPACGEEARSGTLRAKQHSVPESARTEAPAVVDEVFRSAGEPLDAPTRAFFEPRFGRDFSQVRVHTDDRAAKSAQSIDSLAYAAGSHIVFAAGQYAPGGDRGRHLLAHELAHTIQQGAARVRRRPSATEQGVVGLVDSPEETSRYELDEASSVEERIQRSATWNGAVAHETRNMAEIAVGTQNAPITWEVLNGTMLKTTAAADAAIRVPGVTTSPLPSTDPAATWMAKVDTVPAQEGGADETVLGPGPWSKVVSKAVARRVTGIAACTGAGTSTFTAHGSPSDDAVYKANRRHEDKHVDHVKAAFDDAIGKWDKKVQDAKTAGTAFTGPSAADATAALWTAMGNTPKNAARSYSSQVGAAGAAFHGTAAGGPMSSSNPVSNADCSTSAIDVTNPMP